MTFLRRVVFPAAVLAAGAGLPTAWWRASADAAVAASASSPAGAATAAAVPATEGRPRTPEDFFHLRPIAVRIDKLPFDDTIDKLNEAMGSRIRVIDNINSGKRFSVDAKGKEFWEIFQELQAQAPFVFSYQDDELSPFCITAKDNGPGIYKAEVSGPLLIVPYRFDYLVEAAPTYQAAERFTARYSLSLGIYVDPRMIIRGRGITNLEVVDEVGRKVAAKVDGTTIRFDEPDPAPRSISIKGESAAWAYLPEDIAVLELANVKTGQLVNFSRERYVISDFRMTDEEITINIHARTFFGDTTKLHLSFYDAAGKAWRIETHFDADTKVSVTNLERTYRIGRPVRLAIWDADPVHEVVFPFELKDVPLP